jgi:hypothetical protein
MKNLLYVLLLCSLSLHAQEWHSGTKQTQLVELYTSEGCSSCPLADRWLSTHKSNRKLFDDFIPIAFHVDYWDYIGWKDRFASPKHTKRQRQHEKAGNIKQVYTPGFVINSKEWKSWFVGRTKLPKSNNKAGELDVFLEENSQNTKILKVNYSEKQGTVLHVAYLGMGIKNRVKAGENRNKFLKHDFVALNYFSLPGNQKWTVALADVPQIGQNKTALAVWVSNKDSTQVLQAVGGYLDQE